MHDLNITLNQLESNVKSLIRKLNDARNANELLKKENNKLKEELRKKEAAVIEEKELVKVSNHSSLSEEQYHKVKKDIKSCIEEIDLCIQMIEK
jgi:predicted  nucleic acid-binding Zn-ribbon protein